MPITITVPAKEDWDEVREEFISCKGATITLEHSLISLSKWESKMLRPFLTDEKHPHSEDDMRIYIECMTITPNVDPLIYYNLTSDNIRDIAAYIQDPHTATKFYDDPKAKKAKQEIQTSEKIYYYMFSFGIPLECQKWHLNRLLTLIRVFSEENKRQQDEANGKTKKKGLSQEDVLRRNKLNAERIAAKKNKHG